MNLTGLYVQKRIVIYWHIFHCSGFHHICNIKCRLDCRYSPQNIFNAKNFNPHKKPISLLDVPVCTQGMQRTWWTEAGTIIVTGPYWVRVLLIVISTLSRVVWTKKLWHFIRHACLEVSCILCFIQNIFMYTCCRFLSLTMKCLVYCTIHIRCKWTKSLTFLTPLSAPSIVTKIRFHVNLYAISVLRA